MTTDSLDSERQCLYQQTTADRIARLKTASALATEVVHELSQPLTATSSYLQISQTMLRSGTASEQQVMAILDNANRTNDLAIAIIRRLKNYIRSAPPQPKAFDFNRLIRETLILSGSLLHQSQVTPQLRLADPLPPVLADPLQIQQVLLYLLYNALDAMQALAPAQRSLILHTILKRRGKLKMTVSDNGTGLPPELLTQLFQPFFTTKDNGIGLDLSISRSIIEAHHGKIWATLNREQGLSVHFTLPLAL